MRTHFLQTLLFCLEAVIFNVISQSFLNNSHSLHTIHFIEMHILFFRLLYIFKHVNRKLLSSHEDYVFVTISYSIFHILTCQDSLKNEQNAVTTEIS